MPEHHPDQQSESPSSRSAAPDLEARGSSSTGPPPRVGVYVCRCGGNISDVVDVERVAEQARHIPGVCQSKVHTFMCSDPGQHAIIEDIEKLGLDRVVVASCSPMLHEQTFRGAVQRANLNPYLYEHVNIREQGSWAHAHDPQGATAKAGQLIQAAVGKLAHSRPLDKIRLDNHRTALVVGGGVAGMKAATELGRRGIDVLLVEKGPRLGGHVRQLRRVFPHEVQAEALVDELANELEACGRIDVLLRSEVEQLSGFIGNFEVVITGQFGPAGQPERRTATVGAILVATGFEPYTPCDDEYGYRTHPQVMTTYELMQRLSQVPEEAKQLTVNGRPIRSIAMIHCVGSRQVPGIQTPQPDGQVNLHCSRVCCTTILQQAVVIKERFPDNHVYDLHQDIRTYGLKHEQYYMRASDLGVTFLRYHGDQPPRVERNPATGRGAAPLRITVNDYLTWGEEVALDVDLVVLAVGMMPGRIDSLIDMLKLPVGSDRFLQEVHPKLRPVEVSVHGVLLAGTSQGPMTVAESLSAAAAAAAEAAVILNHDHVQRDPFVAQVDLQRCQGCGRCVAECEYSGALQLATTEVDGKTVERAQVNPGLCEGCGACVAVCPHRAIELSGWTLDQYEAMVDGIAMDVPGAEQLAAAVSVP